MSNSSENDNHSAVYRSSDPITNFRIRVRLERLTSNALLPSLQRLKIEEDLSRLLDKDGTLADEPKATKTDKAQALGETKRSEYEEVVIGWQQKLFSHFEYERYGRAVGPESTALEQKYFDDIQKMKANRKQPGRIFTYIEGDPNCFIKDLDYFLTDSPGEEPSQLALGLNNIRKRHVIQKAAKLSDAECLPKTNIINKKPTPDDVRNTHLAALPHQTMYIMADLADHIDNASTQIAVVQPQLDNNRKPNEYVLCVIQAYSDGTIVLEPDFNGGKTAYIVETGNFNNEVYHYYLEHASLSMSTEDLIKEKKLFNEVCLRQQARLTQLVGKEFNKPPPSALVLYIFGEIVSGKNFEYDDLYVYYCLDLPENWCPEPTMLLSGYTPTASTTSSTKNDDTIYYSHPFEFKIWYIPSEHTADHKIPRMPNIYFQVASQDVWGRHRTEGYTYINIPSSPGFYDEVLWCWRPRGDSIFNELRRFYIGGSNELEDISYVAIPKQYEGEKKSTPLSRFGFRTMTTGSINIRFNVVFQSETISVENQRRREAFAIHRYGFDAFMSNINLVLDAFQEAKKRAAAVRESTLKLLTPRHISE